MADRAKTARQLAAEGFAPGDRVRTPDGREGTADSVNEYAAAVVTVTLDGETSISPWLFYTLANLRSQPQVRDQGGDQGGGEGAAAGA